MARLSRAPVTAGGLTATARGGWLPTGAISQSIPRTAVSASGGLTSGRLRMTGGIVIPAGVTVSSITFVSAATALVTGTNQWFALYDKSRNRLAVTVDDTSTAWAAETAKTLALSTPYTVGQDTEVYAGACVVAATPPTLHCGNPPTAIGTLAPVTGGLADTGLTNPASAPATLVALTVAIPAYCYIS